MKIASITVIWNDEQFIRSHFKMISRFDENIVLLGKKPFKDYFQNGLVSDKPDKSEEILRKEFPHVRIFEHNFDSFCGNIFNFGMEKARELNCDVIVKLDPDMLMTDTDFDKFIEQINQNDWDTLLLNYPKNTFVYKKDLEHGTSANIFPVGVDPHAVRINHHFIHDGVRIIATGRQKEFKDIMVHHFTGFKPNTDEEELKRCENLAGFTGWVKAPDEIIKKFKCLE